MSVEIFNTYSDHAAVEYQELGRDDAEFVCDYLLSISNADEHDYEADELGQRQLTVFRTTNASGAQRTVWVYGLAGYNAGTAFVLDTGESFHTDAAPPSAYVGEGAEVHLVDRSELPTR